MFGNVYIIFVVIALNLNVPAKTEGFSGEEASFYLHYL